MNGEEFFLQVRELYEAYVAKTKQLERDKKFGDGFMGLKPGPKDDPCHGRFAEDLEALLGQAPEAALTPDQVRELLAYIYRAPQEHRDPQTAYWMLQAVHGLTVPLVGRLAPRDAEALRDEYAKTYRRWDRLPVQKKVLAALEKAARQ